LFEYICHGRMTCTWEDDLHMHTAYSAVVHWAVLFLYVTSSDPSCHQPALQQPGPWMKPDLDSSRTAAVGR
jgi:hypothetical protein